MGTRTHIYTLRISLAGCRYDVRINDVPIFRDVDAGHPLTGTMAVNEYLRPGGNGLTVALSPQADRRALAEPADTFLIELLEREGHAPKTADRSILRLLLRPGTEEGEAVALEAESGSLTPASGPNVGGDRMSRFTVGLDFAVAGESHNWAWLLSAVIADSDRTRDELRGLYAGWLDRLAAKDASWLAPALTERNEELALALFERRAVVADHGLYEAVNASDQTLFDPELDQSRLLVFGDGRLARLLRWDGSPIITYLQADGINADYYPFTLRKAASGWIICR